MLVIYLGAREPHTQSLSETPKNAWPAELEASKGYRGALSCSSGLVILLDVVQVAKGQYVPNVPAAKAFT